MSEEYDVYVGAVRLGKIAFGTDVELWRAFRSDKSPIGYSTGRESAARMVFDSEHDTGMLFSSVKLLGRK